MRRAPTPAEARLWAALRRRQLDGLRFRRQAPVHGWIADFSCPERWLIVEVDGPSHDAPERRALDAARDAALARRGFRTVRVRNEDVLERLPAVLRAIQDVAEAKRPRGAAGQAGGGPAGAPGASTFGDLPRAAPSERTRDTRP
jgi:very-short-patch-repair endonuclease